MRGDFSMSELGLWGNEKQSDKPLTVLSGLVREICANDHKCSFWDTQVLGWFEVEQDHPDREIGDTVYVQAVELQYTIPDEEWNYLKDLSMFQGREELRHEAKALYGITDDRKIHIWAD